jgi:glycosyltransferase involved in cell wall biosynthesis
MYGTQTISQIQKQMKNKTALDIMLNRKKEDPSVCVWYIVNDEYEALELSLKVMAEMSFVKHICVVDTGDTGVEKTKERASNMLKFMPKGWPTIHREYPDKISLALQPHFGTGFEKSIEEGGFDEVAGRNWAINYAEQQGCEWLLQCDADEFYNEENLYASLVAAEAKKANAIRYSCYSIFNSETAINDPACYQFCGNDIMHDPHVRAWKTNAQVRFVRNPNPLLLAGQKNKSLHCVPAIAENIYNETNIVHIHAHDIFPYKRREWAIPTDQSKMFKIPGIVPKNYKWYYAQHSSEYTTK